MSFLSNLLANSEHPFSKNMLETGVPGLSAFSGSSGGGTAAPATPDDPNVMAYFNSDPAFAAEYSRNRAATGDTRTQSQWLADGLKANPAQLAKYTQFIQSGVNPDNPTGVGVQVPLEQALLQQAMPELQNQIQGDAGRATLAQALQALNAGNVDTYQALMQKLQSGQLLQDQYGNATTVGNTLATDASTAAGAEGEANVSQNQNLLAAADPLFKSRIGAAEDQITGVNLGLQQTLDQLNAERATQGYVGGSTMDQNALEQAAIAANQQGASILGGAKVQNAGDAASINALQANQGYGISTALAQQQQAAYDTAARNKATYFDQQFPAQLGAALSGPGFTQSTIGSNASADQYAISGLNNALGTLNWWSAPTSTPPTPGAIATTASNTGNQISSLGAGLLGNAFASGNLDWWKPTSSPSTTTTTTTNASQIGAGVPNDTQSYANLLCWVAREVFGTADSRWILFREWLTKKAPADLVALYRKNGQALAARLRANPEMKPAIRSFMEARIASL